VPCFWPGAAPTIDAVGTYVELAIAIVLPTAVAYFIVASLWGARWSFERWNTRRYRLRTKPVPIEHIEARLRKLRAELEDTEVQTRLPAKSARLRAVRGAYVDVLTVACERLDVAPPPGGDQTPRAEIYRVEAALRERGLDVREQALR
jgi:hypothetical protein